MTIRAYFSRHAQVLIGSLGRIVHQPFATLMTMGVIAVALALPLFLSLLLQNARTATGNWNEAYDLSVYMDKKAAAARVQSLAKQLRQRGDVAAVRIISAEQALVEFRRDSGFGTALDVLADNPLPDTLVVTPTLASSTPQETETLKVAIAGMGDVQTVQIDTEWVKRLHAMIDLLRWVAGTDAGGGSLGRLGAAGGAAGLLVRQHLQFGGLENRHGRGSSRPRGGAVLAGLLACCNAPYQSDRTGISICF